MNGNETYWKVCPSQAMRYFRDVSTIDLAERSGYMF
jgi:hypothetical protein